MNTSLLPAPEGRRREAEPPETVELGGQLRVVWRYRKVVMACGILGAAVAAAVSFLMPRTYVAEAAMAVSRSKIGEDRAVEALSTANYRPLIENQTIAAEVIKANGLYAKPYYASPTTFFGRIVELEEVRNSSVILIRGYLKDPQLAAAVVNQVASLGAAAARRVSQQEALQARDDIKNQFDEAKARLDIASDALEKARMSSQIELVKQDVDAALLKRGDLLELEINIEAERARLAKAEDELKKRSLVETVHRTIDSAPTLMEAARATGPKPSDLLGLQVKSEEVNPVYQDIDKQIATIRAELAGLEKQKAQMAAQHLDGAQLAKLNELYAKESQITRLELERDLAKKVYQDAATSYESARLLVAGRSSALQIINTAIAPDKPESRYLGRNVLIGTLSGLMLAVLAVLIYNTVSGGERRPAAPTRV